MIKELETVRVDKWLWSVRVFKSRTLASNMCRSKKVKVNGRIVKPAHELSQGDLIAVNKEGYNLSFVVIKLIGKRVSAPLAQTCYKDLTPEEEYRKNDDWFIGKAPAERREKGSGRPTKRERRQIESFKDPSNTTL
jgi:ribosome-associated heat shock protein Hsp15